MKTSLRPTFASLALAAVLAVPAWAGEAGYVDFGKLKAPARGEFVEVNVGKALLKFAGVVVRCENPEAADLIAGISRVRVNVVGMDDSNRTATTERIAAVRADLARDGWEQIVSAQSEKQEDVAIHVKQRDGEVIEGLVITVIDGRKKEAVFVNVVGRIKAEQLAVVGEHLKIPQLRTRVKVEKI
jgi:hypothetical protein